MKLTETAPRAARARRPTLLLLSPPVLYAPTWWSSKVASKPHLYSLAGFVRDIADVRIVELDVLMGTPAIAIDAYLAGMDEHLSLNGVDLIGITTSSPPISCQATPIA